MKPALLFVVLFGLLTHSLPAELDPSAIEWVNVKSSVRWLNLHQGRFLSTLVVDKFPALLGVPPGGYYPPTKFPSGSFPCEIVNSTTRRSLCAVTIDVRNGTQYCLVTFGESEKPPSVLFIPETPGASGRHDSRIIVYNMMPDILLSWPSPHDRIETIGLGKARQAAFQPGNGFRQTIEGRTKDGRKMGFPITIPPTANGANWIAFCHDGADDGQQPAVSYIQESSTTFVSGTGPSVE